MLLNWLNGYDGDQLEHAWRGGEEGGTCDKRYHRDGVFCCIQYSPCQVAWKEIKT